MHTCPQFYIHISTYNPLNLYGWRFLTSAGQWAREPRPYDYGHTSHKCQQNLVH